MSENKLPADPLALTLGIVGIVMGILGCCLTYGLTSIIPLAISIVGFVSAKKSLRAYRENPEKYSEASKSNVTTGKIINIISIVFNGIAILFVLIGLLFFGTFFYKMFDSLDQDGFFDKYESYETEERDTIYDYENDYDSTEVDTIETDSTIMYEIKEIETSENKIE